MTYRGRVKDGTVVFDGPLNLPEGTEVEIVRVLAVTDEGSRSPEHKPVRNLFEALGQVIGSIDDLPVDSSENLDHYLYGAPRQ